jgi:zinc protease
MALFSRLALIACAGSCFASVAHAAPLPVKADDKVWAQTQSDIAPDPDVHFGRLANGMRYAILKNATPPGQVSIRLLIGSGSMEERDDQQGLAHFLEHMAFKGSTNVPEGEMIKLLERHGLAFGPDTNAQTGFTDTVFMLDLPQSGNGTLDLGLKLMRETASELTLTQSAMNPERGVVLSEERLRDTPDYEALKQRFKVLFSGQLAADRFPIGQVDILKTAPASLIRAYYTANYRPDRATLIVVGDIDSAALEAQIEAVFGNWKPVGPETKEPDFGHIVKRGPQTQLIVKPGAHPNISLTWVNPFEATPDTEAKSRREQVEQVAIAVLNRRLSRAAQSDAAPFVGAGASIGDQIESARLTSLALVPKPGGWKIGLQALLHIERQAVELGVDQAEVNREITEFRTKVQTAAAGAATQRTPDLAQGLVQSVEEDEVFTSPVQDLKRYEAEIGGLTAANVSETLKRMFSGQGPLLSMVSPDPIDGGEAALAAAFDTARTDRIDAAVVHGVKAWPYADFGAPGRVKSRRDVADLGVTFVEFANGVHLNIKPTAFRKDQIMVNVRIGDGRLSLPEDRKTELWGEQALILGGFGKISLEDAEQVLASKLFGAQLATTDDAMVLGGETRPADLDTQLQVLAAYVGDPGFQPAGFKRIQNALATQLDQVDATPQGVLGRDLALLQHSGDLRWANPTQADVKAGDLQSLKALLLPQLRSAPLEVDVAGDVKPEDVIRAVAATFGALPPRPEPVEPPPAALDVHFPKTGDAPVDLHHKGRADQAIAYEAWPSDGLFADPQAARITNIAAQVVELRLIDRVRVAEGSTYSPSVYSNPSDVFPHYGVVAASVETPPAKIERFYAAVHDITADLASKGPTADELQRAVKPRIETLAKAQQTNEYWMTWIAGADHDPRRLDIVRDTLPGYSRITAPEVQAAAHKYLSDAQAWKLEITPRAEAKGSSAAGQ